MNPLFRDTVDKLLEFDPNIRPDIRELLSFPLFRLSKNVSSNCLSFKRCSVSQQRTLPTGQKPLFNNKIFDHHKNYLKKEAENPKNEFITLNQKSFKILNTITTVTKSPEIVAHTKIPYSPARISPSPLNKNNNKTMYSVDPKSRKVFNFDSEQKHEKNFEEKVNQIFKKRIYLKIFLNKLNSYLNLHRNTKQIYI